MEYILAVITLAMLVWLWSGLFKLNIMWKAAPTFFGKRTGGEQLEEGWHCRPWPCGAIEVDCHQKTIMLKAINDVKTSDGVVIKTITGSLIRGIADVNLFLNADSKTVEDGLNGIWDERIRVLVGQMTLDEVQRTKDTLARSTRAGMDSLSNVHWGIKIIEVNVLEVETDEGVREDQERVKREQLQREGQRVQAEWSGQLEQFFLGNEPLTPGGVLCPKLSQEMAHELTLYTLELAEKKKIESKTFGLDPTTATAVTTAITAALVAIKGGRP
jgi:regulator of protease activity HflC (stomatin/prohibitin superfamily)